MRIVRTVQLCRVDNATPGELAWISNFLAVPTIEFTGGRPTPSVREYFDNRRRSFPPGLLKLVQREAASEGFVVDVVDERQRPPGMFVIPKTFCTKTPHAYQVTAAKKAHAAETSLVEIGTAGGKSFIATIIFASVQFRCIYVVSTEHLAEQAAMEFELETGERAGRVFSGRIDFGARCIFATFGTLYSHMKSDPGFTKQYLQDYGWLVVDECFVAGTPVGGRPIEMIKPGDLVPSYDEQVGAFVQRRVVQTMASRPAMLVRAYISRNIVLCTPGHPFLTGRGWVAAIDLWPGDEVFHAPQERLGQDGRGGVYAMRNHTHGEPWNARGEDSDRRYGRLGPRVLQQGVQLGLEERGDVSLATAGVRRGQGAQEQGKLDPDASAQPVKHARRLLTNGRDATRERDGQPGGPWWERMWADDPPSTARESDGDDNRTRHPDGRAAPRLPDDLQGGPREPVGTARGRGRQEQPQREAPDSRREEGRRTDRARVDSVEVLERGGDGRYGGLCPNGLVYNLEVEGTHTYLVGSGLVVHNCHEVPARTFNKVALAISAFFRTGLSATPLSRSDGKAMGVIAATGPLCYRKTLRQLADEGHAAMATIRMVRYVQDVFVGPWQKAYLYQIVRDAGRNALIASMAMHARKPCLVLFNDKEHGATLLRVLQARGVKAERVDGRATVSLRKALAKKLDSEDVDVVIASKVFRTGVNIRHLRTVINAAGRKSEKEVVQGMGRGARLAEEDSKSTFDVWDVFDTSADGRTGKGRWVADHARVRLRVYRKQGNNVLVADTVRGPWETFPALDPSGRAIEEDET